MSLLIGTPCYGNMVTAAYLRSALLLCGTFNEIGMKYDFFIPEKNDSLVQRARNRIASMFMTESDYQKLLFIDADIEFTAEDVAKLWNMDAEIAVGVYRMKKEESEFAAWYNGELVKELDSLPNPCPVDYAGTGFMMIDRCVFEKMKSPEIEHEEGGVEKCWAFFNPRLDDGIYLSEDYAFCLDARNLGFEIWMDTTVRLKHWGDRAYS